MSTAIDGNHNFSHTPGFAYAYSDDPNVLLNVHLAYDSFCKDKGNPNLSYANQTDIDNDGRVADTYVDIGADEITCEEIVIERDWNADGLVNIYEFSTFSKAWLSHDPNDPVCNPSNPNYVSDPNAPGYISASAKANWNPTCNLDTNGAGIYAVDLYDFTAFCENWLWQACWKDTDSMMMAMGGGFTPESMIQTESLQTEKVATEVAPQKSIREQVIDLKKAVEFLEKIWLTEPDIQQDIDAQQWQRFMDDIYNSLDELQNIKTKTYIEEILQ